MTERELMLKCPGYLMQRVIGLLGEHATPTDVDAMLASLGDAAPLLLARRKALRAERRTVRIHGEVQR